MLNDKRNISVQKHIEDIAKIKLIKRFDPLTGKTMMRKASKIHFRGVKEKNHHAQMSDIRPNGFGKSTGICQKSLDNNGAEFFKKKGSRATIESNEGKADDSVVDSQ